MLKKLNNTLYYIMKDFFVCFCKECKEKDKVYYAKLLTEKLFGDVYCYHSWKNNLSKHKLNNARNNEKN